MANIYELTGAFNKLWELIDEGEIDNEVLLEVFDDTTTALKEKLEGYCKFLRNVEADVEALKAEEKRLYNRRKTMENNIDRAKAVMKLAMEAAEEKKLSCGTFTVSIRNNPPKVVIDEAFIGNIPAKYLIQPPPEINKKAIMEDLKADVNTEALEGVAHLEQGTSISIR